MSSRAKNTLQAQLGHQRAVGMKVSYFAISKTTTAVKGVEHRQTINFEKNWKRIYWFSEVSKEKFHYYHQEA